MLVLALRAMILFLLVFAATRIMGKREIGQLQPYEFVIALMIADLASAPVSDTAIPLVHGIIPIVVITGLHLLISLLSLKSPRLRQLFSGHPITLIRAGRIQEQAMKSLRYNFSDLFEELRVNGIASIADVELAVMETSGKVSILPKADKRPLQAADLKIELPPDVPVYHIILDGVLREQTLQTAGFTKKWLHKNLHAQGYSACSEVFFASVTADGTLYLQGYGEDHA